MVKSKKSTKSLRPIIWAIVMSAVLYNRTLLAQTQKNALIYSEVADSNLYIWKKYLRYKFEADIFRKNT